MRRWFMDNFMEKFRTALLFAIAESSEKQGVIADNSNITSQYLTHIKKGNKDGTEEVRDLSEFDLWPLPGELELARKAGVSRALRA